jgi:hypothetical protein
MLADGCRRKAGYDGCGCASRLLDREDSAGAAGGELAIPVTRRGITYSELLDVTSPRA